MAKTSKPDQLIRPGHKALYAALVALVACVALWVLFTGKARHDAQDAQRQTAQAATTLAQDEARLSDLRAGKQGSADALLAKAQELDRLLPSRLDPVALATSVEGLATGAGLQLDTMNPVPADTTTSPAPAGSQTYDVSVTGGPAGVTAFLDRLSKMRPLVTVSGFSMTITPGSTGAAATATATMKLTTWTVPDGELSAL